MMFTRYVIAAVGGSALHGNYSGVRQLWDHGDGTAMFKVECSETEFEQLNADNTLNILPSLNTPVAKLGPKAQAFIAKQGVTPVPGDTVLNVLRAIRDAKGLTANIDSPN